MILELDRLTKSFGGVVAVDNVHLKVQKGTIEAIIGPNGAGKTTLFNLISGFYPPDKGKVLFEGKDIAGQPSFRICKKGVGRAFQIINIYPELSIFQNVQIALLSHKGGNINFFSPVRGMLKKEAEDILETVGLSEQMEFTASSLSQGDKKRLDFAIALGIRPKLLLLDEPTAGMSPEETLSTVKLIEKLSQERNLTIVFTEHDMSVVFRIAKTIAVLHQGRVIVEGKPEEVRNNEQVQKVYLGEE